MKKHNKSNSRNFGYGKQMTYAAKQALDDRYGESGKFATKASHSARFSQFSQWCKAHGINDTQKINESHVNAYAKELASLVQAEQKSVSYAQNQLSSVNVVLSTMRGDNQLKVSPSELIGERCHIRQTVPLSLDRAVYKLALAKLSTQEAKLALSLAREFGLRLREVGLFRPQEAINQYLTHGKINIQRGVKGGRTAERLIVPNDKQLGLISAGQRILASNKCLVDKAGKYTSWKNQLYKEYYQSGAFALIGKFHDNRAAFACEQYKQMTNIDAPVITGRRTANRKLDFMARQHCSGILGHNRVDVIASYIGSAR